MHPTPIPGADAALSRLLDLLEADDVPTALDDALRALVEATGAVGAYVEIDGESIATRHSVGLPPDGAERARLAVSRGVVGEAIATGRTIESRALLDPRFMDRESVRAHAVDAVLCAPVGRPPRGAVYLQGRPGIRFGEADIALVERFGRHLWSVVDRIALARALAAKDDPTAPWRARLRCEALIGRSEALAAVLRELDQAAPTDLSVLLLGPSGTGKSALARVLHDSSPRAKAPFHVVDCPSVPEGLFEIEMFGAEPGAAANVTRRTDGQIRAAAGGTLFLDEVGDLSPVNQTRLLHFLQTRTVKRLGSTRWEPVDVRVVAATNREVEGSREFRSDLYWRLAGFPIRIPSLDARADDLPLLLRAFAAAACVQLRCEPVEVGPGAVAACAARQWPGNLRELQNVVQRGVARARQAGDRQLGARHLFPELPPGEAVSFQEHTRRFQAQLLRDTLVTTRWNVTETARRLDLARSHVYRLIASFGLDGAPER